MAPEQMELQELAEAWNVADFALEDASSKLSHAQSNVESKRAEVSRLADALKQRVGANITHKLIEVDKEMGDHVLIEHVVGAHGDYVSVRRLRVE